MVPVQPRANAAAAAFVKNEITNELLAKK